MTTTMENTNEADIVVPPTLSVGQLRAWLAQFAEDNREHYESNMVQKKEYQRSARPPLGSLQQHLDRTASSTSSTVSSSHDSLVGLHGRSMDELSIQQEQEITMKPRPADASSYFDVERRRSSEDDSIFQHLEDAREHNAEGTIEGYSHQVLDVFKEDEEEYRIVSIRKLLEAPKPTRRHDVGTAWDEYLDDDFSDPFAALRRTPAQVSKSKETALTMSPSPNRPRFTNNVGSTSLRKDTMVHSPFRNKNLSSDDEVDSLSTKSRSSSRSLRSRLPMLLCKSGKEENIKHIQRTYHNGPLPRTHPFPAKGPLRPLSPYSFHDTSDFTSNRAADDSELCPLTEKESFHGYGDEFAQSTVSCPDFAAATTYLQKFNVSEATQQQEQNQTNRREMRSHRFSRKESEHHGTSAILPGAVDPALSEMFSLDDKDDGKPGKVRLNDDYGVRTKSRNESRNSAFERVSRVSETVSQFGGNGRRYSTVQLRQKELERQWATSRAVQHVKKVRWQVCTSTGNYKKRIVVDPEPST